MFALAPSNKLLLRIRRWLAILNGAERNLVKPSALQRDRGSLNLARRAHYVR